WDHILTFLLIPLAGEPEPIFPYLAVSFIGSIIGIELSKPRTEIKRDFPKKMMYIGFIMFIVGTVGILLNVGIILMEDMDRALGIYRNLWDHRYWTPEHGVPFLGWLFQFLSLNGISICWIMLVIRMVEFRGNGKIFAQKTTFIRRFGYIAFTIYTIQFIYYIPQRLVSMVAGIPYHNNNLDWMGTFIAMGISILLFHLIMLAWERVNYIGSLEWSMKTIAYVLIPARKQAATSGRKWWQVGQLNVKESFYNAEWLNIVEKSELDHENLVESKLAFKLSLLGLVLGLVGIIIFFAGFLLIPFSIMGYYIGKQSEKLEQVNEYNKKAKIIGIIGMVIFLSLIVISSIFSAADLGLADLF
ncbi:MAG: hypothetical protein ACTSYS_03160, partial [Promethearchaeota archaeon]